MIKWFVFLVFIVGIVVVCVFDYWMCVWGYGVWVCLLYVL